MKKQIIGAIHFPPMPGYPDYPGFDVALQNTLADAIALRDGGVDCLVIENNYDIPHKEKISSEVLDEMIKLGKEIKSRVDLPVGVSVLWNDYESAFKIAKEIGGEFIRVPVFVDTVEKEYGVMKGNPSRVVEVRKNLNAENVKIYADIHVKHSKILSPYSIEQSAKLAIENGADALIVTGKWTSDAPNLDELIKVKETVGEFPIFCGSGVNSLNIKKLFEYADGAIVSTSLKEESKESHEQNIKPFDARIDKVKVHDLVLELNK